ncbi:MAG: SDR family oxidoreductase [Thermomicrobiales bacterium]
MTVLVTGGAGFIGSHLVQRLVTDGYHVRVLDNLSNGFQTNLDRIDGDFEFIQGDLRNEDDVRLAVAGVDLVFHEGALGSVPRSIADPRTSFDVNVTGTLNLLVAARDAGVRRVVYASSSSVYGDTTVSPKHEGLTPNPLSPYAISKLSAEQLCGVFTRVYGLETVALRYFNVFGPHQNPISQYAAVIPKFLTAIASGERPIVFGDGEQSRAFTYVDNVVNGNLLAGEAPAAVGKVINLAADTAVTINSMLRRMGELLGIDPNPRHEPPRVGDIRDSLADLTCARELLGFELTVPFEEGIARTVAAFQATHRDVLTAVR